MPAAPGSEVNDELGLGLGVGGWRASLVRLN